MPNHKIIVATISSGNVQHIERRTIRTASGVVRLSGSNKDIWVDADTLEALGQIEGICYGRIGGVEVSIKSAEVIADA